MPLSVKIPIVTTTEVEDNYQYLLHSTGGTAYYLRKLEAPMAIIYTGSLGTPKLAYFASISRYPYMRFFVNENNVLTCRSLLDGSLLASASATGQKPYGTGYDGQCYTNDGSPIIREWNYDLSGYTAINTGLDNIGGMIVDHSGLLVWGGTSTFTTIIGGEDPNWIWGEVEEDDCKVRYLQKEGSTWTIKWTVELIFDQNSIIYPGIVIPYTFRVLNAVPISRQKKWAIQGSYWDGQCLLVIDGTGAEPGVSYAGDFVAPIYTSTLGISSAITYDYLGDHIYIPDYFYESSTFEYEGVEYAAGYYAKLDRYNTSCVKLSSSSRLFKDGSIGSLLTLITAGIGVGIFEGTATVRRLISGLNCSTPKTYAIALFDLNTTWGAAEEPEDTLYSSKVTAYGDPAGYLSYWLYFYVPRSTSERGVLPFDVSCVYQEMDPVAVIIKDMLTRLLVTHRDGSINFILSIKDTSSYIKDIMIPGVVFNLHIEGSECEIMEDRTSVINYPVDVESMKYVSTVKNNDVYLKPITTVDRLYRKEV